MHKKIAALLSFILLIVLIIFMSWEEKKPEPTSLPAENTTEVFTAKDQRLKRASKEAALRKAVGGKAEVFNLINTKAKTHTVTLTDQRVMFQNTTQPIVIINLFATWCPPCIGEIPYLNDLQKKYKKELFIAGILTHDPIEEAALERFMARNQVNYFISNSTNNDAFSDLLASTLHLSENFSIPLTVMYVKGEYFTHYEGSVPVEMIEYDIEQAKKQLKSR